MDVNNNNERLSSGDDVGGREEIKEIYFDGFYYDVTTWVDRHPGGKQIISFYTDKGEDATLPIQQFHHRSIKKVMAVMKSLKKRPSSSPPAPVTIGVNEDSTTNEEQTLDPKTMERHARLTQDFLKLYSDLESEGFFKPSLWHVAFRALQLIFMGLLGIALTTRESLICQTLGILTLSIYAGQSGFAMHEGGHNALTGWPKIDRLLQALAFGMGLGMSASWYSTSHNQHHAMPQKLNRDVDLDTLPFLAFNEKVVVNNPKKARGFFIQNQAYLFLVLDTMLISLWWKFIVHPMHSLKNGAYHELLFMAMHYPIVYLIGVGPMILIAWLGSAYLLGHISLSHLHLPLAKGQLHWVEYALHHTTNIKGSWFIDWWMGYLNYQIEHHLFPTMPGFKNRQVTRRVKELAAKHGIPYYCCTYTQAVKQCLANLAHVSYRLKHQ